MGDIGVDETKDVVQVTEMRRATARPHSRLGFVLSLWQAKRADCRSHDPHQLNGKTICSQKPAWMDYFSPISNVCVCTI